MKYKIHMDQLCLLFSNLVDLFILLNLLKINYTVYKSYKYSF